MKKLILLAGVLIVLLAVNYNIFTKERTLAKGKTMLLTLAPVDPRSLIQGDYMILRYVMADNIPQDQLTNRGRIVVTLDEKQVAKFVRIDDNSPLNDDEYLLAYRNLDGLRLGAESFFFQEGDSEIFSKAHYGELRVDQAGASVLVGLRGEDFVPLGAVLK